MKFDLGLIQRNGGIKRLEDASPETFICCASFESRSRSVTEHLSRDYRANKALIYVNREFLESHSGSVTRKNLYFLIDRLARHCEDVSVVEGSWLSNADQLHAIQTAVQSLPLDALITLDCTTFNRESLLTMLLCLSGHFTSTRLRVLYSSPLSHGDWLSRGFRTIRNVIGFGGTRFPGRPTLLVVLSGFESHRTQKVIEELEPSVVLLGVGNPPTQAEFLVRNKVEQELILSRQDIREFNFDAGDISICKSQMLEALSLYMETHNIVIAPMSTKMSTIATFLVAESDPNIQLTYCLPGEYNTNDYSEGAKSIYDDVIERFGGASQVHSH